MSSTQNILPPDLSVISSLSFFFRQVEHHKSIIASKFMMENFYALKRKTQGKKRTQKQIHTKPATQQSIGT